MSESSEGHGKKRFNSAVFSEFVASYVQNVSARNRLLHMSPMGAQQKTLDINDLGATGFSVGNISCWI